MVAASIRKTLAELKEERERLDSAIEKLESVLESLSGIGRADHPLISRGRGRPPGKPQRKNAPRGLLRELMHQALRNAGKSLAPSVLRDRVLKAGYPSNNPKALYTAVYNAASKDPDIKKTKEGFALKASARKK